MSKPAVILTIISLAISVLSLSAQKKQALLMVHFGSTFDDTRAATIDVINREAAKAFPDMEVREAFTSRIVMKRLRERGIRKDSPRQALLRLAADGYEEVFVQSTNIIDGIEAAVLREEVEYMAPFFKEIRVGRPLLYSLDDCLQVCRILSDAYPASKNHSYVFVGHGTHTPANAIYSQIDYMMKAEGRADFQVCTVEGYPTLENVIKALRQNKEKSVTLVPFMFVAGDHAHNDIATDMCGRLQQEGFKADAIMAGLGQMPSIRQLFIDHIRQGLVEKPLSPAELKRKFLSEQ
ncbi:MAG: sirohydrochlorin cobaltochelatase [Muribaculaceae bacterium]|nr:sirohydrochlorin cobaltochelatase [Muribaculaceae bacterium]